MFSKDTAFQRTKIRIQIIIIQKALWVINRCFSYFGMEVPHRESTVIFFSLSKKPGEHGLEAKFLYFETLYV